MTSQGQTPLQAELSSSPLNREQLEMFVFRSKETKQLVDQIKDEYFSLHQNTPEIHDMSRVDAFRKVLRHHSIIRQNTKYNLMENKIPRWALLNTNFLMPTGVHWTLSNPMFQTLASDDQKEELNEKIANNEVIFAYIQTELGHGSDIQSLETTATFDQKTQEFVINTPTVTATKFWPGELGVIANYGIVFANLIIGQKNYGVHPFVCRIRDHENHRALPNLEIGEIGPKLGYNTKDNGYIVFREFRVPRTALLGRFYEVSPDGKYTQRGNPKIMYSGMMHNRTLIIFISYYALACSLSVACRYSIVRKQFKDSFGVERVIGDYQLQQAKIIPAIANLYAMRATDLLIESTFNQHFKNVEKNDFSLLGELHVLLSGCKASFTSWSLYGIEIVRQACGGHGYSHLSGVPAFLLDSSPNVTLEGENTVMHLQVARFLVKTMKQVSEGASVPESVSYLAKKDVSQKATFESFEDLIKSGVNGIGSLVEMIARLTVQRAALKLLNESQQLGLKESWDTKAGIKLLEAARLHILQVSYQAMASEAAKFTDKLTNEAITNLTNLFGLSNLMLLPSLLVGLGVLSPSQTTELKLFYNHLLKELRPHMVVLVEAFGIDSRTTVSAIGHENCDPYNNLYNWAKNYSVMNRIDLTETVRMKYSSPKI